MDSASRAERRHPEDRSSSGRTTFERDSDRLLYCSAFRRLANVTQVVAADQGVIFHNRLTHALKVAQIGRRLAQKLTRTEADRERAEKLGGLDPDVVEAAGLAHDLGHPPFGHLAEKALDDLITKKQIPGGYEGNAQAFRIVTKLAIRSHKSFGLNLTRATLNSILKYPWLRQTEGKKAKKWGAYGSEEEDFLWAREGVRPSGEKTLEAEVMDFADDIAYSIFDLEDFYRAGKIPLERLGLVSDRPSPEARLFLTRAFARWKEQGEPADNQSDYESAFDRLRVFFPKEPYSGTREERASLRDATSVFVGRYMGAIEMSVPASQSDRTVTITDSYEREIRLLKELTWQYVIKNPALATQQHGYRLVIEGLFEDFFKAATAGNLSIFPVGIQEWFQDAMSEAEIVRTVADTIAIMSESQALEMFQRLRGITIGSFFKTIV